jgi:hypothetical protein
MWRGFDSPRGDTWRRKSQILCSMSKDAAIEALVVARIRHEAGRPTPTIDPNGPRSSARVLVVLRDPGELGARQTGVLSPITNDDQTARNMRRLWAEAGLDMSVCIFWNAVPWALEGRRKPTSGEIARGARYLRELVQLLPRLQAVLAMGCDSRPRAAVVRRTSAGAAQDLDASPADY